MRNCNQAIVGKLVDSFPRVSETCLNMKANMVIE